jgi:hypothetical protein
MPEHTPGSSQIAIAHGSRLDRLDLHRWHEILNFSRPSKAYRAFTQGHGIPQS